MADGTSAERAESRRRRAGQLGELLPDTTSDETADWGDRASDRDAEILREVPPHH